MAERKSSLGPMPFMCDNRMLDSISYEARQVNGLIILYVQLRLRARKVFSVTDVEPEKCRDSISPAVVCLVVAGSTEGL